jgi:hypothetical protein
MSFPSIPTKAVQRLQARTDDQLRSDYREAVNQAAVAVGERRNLLFTVVEWTQEVLASRIGWVEMEKFDDMVWAEANAKRA